MTRRRSSQVLITNIVSLNPGDAAILWGMLRILRRRYGPDTHVIVSDRAAEAAACYYPWAQFRQALFSPASPTRLQRWLGAAGYGHWHVRQTYGRLRVALWLLKHQLSFLAALFTSRSELSRLRDYFDADLIISSGGTYLIENYDLSAALYDYRLSLAAGKPLVFFTQTLGPFLSKRNRIAFRDVFSRSTSILLRDERSRQHLLDIGLGGENIALASDAAFVIDTDAASESAHSNAPRIAVSVRSLKFFQEPTASSKSFPECVAHMVTVAVREFGAKIVFLSTCQGMPEYWTDDSKTAAEIVESLPEDVRVHVEVDRKFRQPQEVAVAYAGFDLVVATRMHAAILAMISGVPVIGFAYEFKMEELFDQLGISEVALPIRTLDLAAAESAIRKVLIDLPFWKDKVVEGVPRLREQAWSVVDQLPDLK